MGIKVDWRTVQLDAFHKKPIHLRKEMQLEARSLTLSPSISIFYV